MPDFAPSVWSSSWPGERSRFHNADGSSGREMRSANGIAVIVRGTELNAASCRRAGAPLSAATPRRSRDWSFTIGRNADELRAQHVRSVSAVTVAVRCESATNTGSPKQSPARSPSAKLPALPSLTMGRVRSRWRRTSSGSAGCRGGGLHDCAVFVACGVQTSYCAGNRMTENLFVRQPSGPAQDVLPPALLVGHRLADRAFHSVEARDFGPRRRGFLGSRSYVLDSGERTFALYGVPNAL